VFQEVGQSVTNDSGSRVSRLFKELGLMNKIPEILEKPFMTGVQEVCCTQKNGGVVNMVTEVSK